MNAKDRIDLRAVHHSLFDHQRGTAFFAGGRAFFGGLEDEYDGSLDLVLHPGKHLGGAHQHRDMCIVAAGVHHADILSVKNSFLLRRKRKGISLRHRKAVHICPKPDHRPRLSALQDADHASLGDTGFDFETKLSQVLFDEFCGLYLAVPELGILVYVTSPINHLRHDLCRSGLDLFAHIDGQSSICKRKNGEHRHQHSFHLKSLRKELRMPRL